MTSFESALGYEFKDARLLDEALTHSSYSSEHGGKPCNERLEFLGDSVLGLIVSHSLYLKFPDKDEGFLSKLKSYLVSRKNLAAWGIALEMGKHLNFGEGEIHSGGRNRESTLSNSVEAVIGAIYLDGGFAAAKKFINSWFKNQKLDQAFFDYKSILQEKIQKKFKKPPVYSVISTIGPEHNKTFTVKVKNKSGVLGTGSGKSKKEAEQAAAKNALEKFKNYEAQQ